MDALNVPDKVLNDQNAQEVLRAWIMGDVNFFAAFPSAWKDPFCWGIFLVDLARHVAQGYAKDGRGEIDAMLRRIKEGFDAEWEVNTSDVETRSI